MVMEYESLKKFAVLMNNHKSNHFKGKLKVGADLGTANIVLSVVDAQNNPVAGASCPSTVVKDGLVVDFVGAIQILKTLKRQLEENLGVELMSAATAIPPGILSGNARCISNVVEGAGFEVTNVVDEPTAAAAVLGVRDGAVVDVGGGTTGISILKDGKVIYTADEATGGTHMTLVLAGYYGISLAEAEQLKKQAAKEPEIFPVIKPVVQKMAVITKKFLTGYQVPAVYLVGGACSFTDFLPVFEGELGIKTVKSNDPLLVTPLGIAMSSI